MSDLSLVLGIVGATGSTTICYILPGLFYYKVCEDRRPSGTPRSSLQFASLLLIIIGFIIMISSLSYLLFGVKIGH